MFKPAQRLLVLLCLATAALFVSGCADEPVTSTAPAGSAACEPDAKMACGCGELGGSSESTCTPSGTWGECPCGPSSPADVGPDALASDAPQAALLPENVSSLRPVAGAAQLQSPNYRLRLSVGVPHPSVQLESPGYKLTLGQRGGAP